VRGATEKDYALSPSFFRSSPMLWNQLVRMKQSVPVCIPVCGVEQVDGPNVERMAPFGVLFGKIEGVTWQLS
jgi:hypothetical protein